jgi:hypothetical protein
MGFFGIYCVEGTFRRFLRCNLVRINDNNDKVTGSSLRPQETLTIGVIVSDITNWFFGAVVKVVGDVAKSRGSLANIASNCVSPRTMDSQISIAKVYLFVRIFATSAWNMKIGYARVFNS